MESDDDIKRPGYYLLTMAARDSRRALPALPTADDEELIGLAKWHRWHKLGCPSSFL